MLWFIVQLIVSVDFSYHLTRSNFNIFLLSYLLQGFNIYINGSFHCCLRYKQLHSLHEQLKRSLLNLSLPQFPPKKLLTLTQSELEQRRIALERYMQLSKNLLCIKCIWLYLSSVFSRARSSFFKE